MEFVLVETVNETTRMLPSTVTYGIPQVVRDECLAVNSWESVAAMFGFQIGYELFLVWFFESYDLEQKVYIGWPHAFDQLSCVGDLGPCQWAERVGSKVLGGLCLRGHMFLFLGGDHGGVSRANSHVLNVHARREAHEDEEESESYISLWEKATITPCSASEHLVQTDRRSIHVSVAICDLHLSVYPHTIPGTGTEFCRQAVLLARFSRSLRSLSVEIPASHSAPTFLGVIVERWFVERPGINSEAGALRDQTVMYVHIDGRSSEY